MNKHRKSQDIKSFGIKMVYMISRARRKVKEGKLVKVELEYDNVVRKIKITGDFFLHPEDALEKIEEGMLDTRKDESMEAIASKVQRAMNAQCAQMIGLSPESLALVIKEALK